MDTSAKVYTRTGDEIPLAILHIVAAIEEKSHDMSQPVTDFNTFIAHIADDFSLIRESVMITELMIGWSFTVAALIRSCRVPAGAK